MLVVADQFIDANGQTVDLGVPLYAEESAADRYNDAGHTYLWHRPGIVQEVAIPEFGGFAPTIPQNPPWTPQAPTPNPPGETRGGWVAEFADRIVRPVVDFLGFAEPNPPTESLDIPQPFYASAPPLGYAEPNPPTETRDIPQPYFASAPPLGYAEPNPPFETRDVPIPFTSSRDPVDPRILAWVPVGMPEPNPPTGYRTLETFPVPQETKVQSPVPSPSIEGSLRPREYFPENPGHGWFWNDSLGRYVDLRSDFLTPGEQYAPPPDSPAPGPVPQAPTVLDVERPGWSDATWDKYRADMQNLLARSAPQNPATPAEPLPDLMPRAALASTGTGDVSSDTPDSGNLDTNALLQQALKIVGDVATNFTQQTPTSPSPTANPKTSSAEGKWYQYIPFNAWLLAGGAALLLLIVLRKK